MSRGMLSVVAVVLASLSDEVAGSQASTPWQTDIARLETLRQSLTAMGVDTTPELTTINGTYVLFELAAAWDTSHASSIADAWCTFMPKLDPSVCASLGASQTANLSSQLTVVLSEAIDSAEWVVQHPQARLPAPRPPLGPGSTILSRSEGGYLIRNGSSAIVFPNGYTESDAGAPQQVACGLGTVEVYLSPDQFLQSGPVPDPDQVKRLREGMTQTATNSYLVSGFIAGNALPAWAAAKYPGINDCVPPKCMSHFMEYDWFNPGALDVFEDLFNTTLQGPAANVSLEINGAAVNALLLVNEPGVTAVNSTFAQQSYTAYLAARYGSVEALNTAYGSGYAALSDVPVSPTPKSPTSVAGGAVSNASNLEAARRWFDWQAWSQSAYRGYYHAMKQAAQGAVSGIPLLAPIVTHMKIAANHLGGNQHFHGLDLVSLLADHAISGTDSRAGPGNVTVFDRPEPFVEGTYSGFYLSQLTYFPFARSLAPKNPLFDSETHAVSTVRYRGALPRGYTRFFEWLSTLLGRSLSINWYWSRNADGSKLFSGYNNVSFPDSLLTQPYALDEQARALWELSTMGEQVRSLVSDAPRPVSVWYSRLSLINEPTSAASLVRAVEVTTSVPFGGQIGYVAERLVMGKQLETGNTDDEAALCSRNTTCVGARAAEEAAGAMRLQAFARSNKTPKQASSNRVQDAFPDTNTIVVPLAPYAEDAALQALQTWLASNSSRRIVVMGANCTAGPATEDACSLFRLRANSTQRPVQQLSWMDGPQVVYVEPRDPQAMVEAATDAILAPKGPARSTASCLVGGQPLLGLACWLAPGTSTVKPTLFAVNMRSTSVTFDIEVDGIPLKSAVSLFQEPPFGVEAPELPSLTLDPFRVAALQL